MKTNIDSQCYQHIAAHELRVDASGDAGLFASLLSLCDGDKRAQALVQPAVIQPSEGGADGESCSLFVGFSEEPDKGSGKTQGQR